MKEVKTSHWSSSVSLHLNCDYFLQFLSWECKLKKERKNHFFANLLEKIATKYNIFVFEDIC